jgi:hypothetical protein
MIGHRAALCIGCDGVRHWRRVIIASRSGLKRAWASRVCQSVQGQGPISRRVLVLEGGGAAGGFAIVRWSRRREGDGKDRCVT